MNINKFLKDKERAIVITGFIMVTLFWFVIPLIKDIKRHNRLASDGIYTIGKVEDFYDDHHSSPAVMYRFVYKGKSYKDSSGVEYMNRSLIGKRFYVLFLSDHPLTSRILLNKPVPAAIQEAPPAGWQEIPN